MGCWSHSWARGGEQQGWEFSCLECSWRLCGDHTFHKSNGLLTPTPDPTPSVVSDQEILAADLTNHSAAQLTDTTLCPNQEGAEWEKTVIYVGPAGERRIREGTESSHHGVIPVPPPHPEPIFRLFFIPLLLFQQLSVSSWPCLNMLSFQTDARKDGLKKVCKRRPYLYEARGAARLGTRFGGKRNTSVLGWVVP